MRASIRASGLRWAIPHRAMHYGSVTEALHKAIQKLSPRNDVQISLKSQAVGIGTDLRQLRWLLFEQSGTSISAPLLIVVISWLAIIFALGPVRAV